LKDEQEAAQSAIVDNTPPKPRVTEISNDGKMKVEFDKKLRVPENM
jgi:hypothetical protein